MLALLIPLLVSAGAFAPLETQGETPAASALPGLGPAPRCAVLEGRARVWSEAGMAEFSRGFGWEASSRRQSGYLELGPAARIELAWSGLASAQVLGPAAVEWTLDKNGAPSLFVWRADRIELDVRRGGFSLNYAGRVAVDCGRGALSLREVGGGLRVRQHGGEPGVLWVHQGDLGAPRWAGKPLTAGRNERVLWTQEAADSPSP